MSDKYSENIQQIAKEMAEAYGNHIVPSGMITAACVAVRWATPIARASYMRGASDKAQGLHCDSVDCDLYMQSIGLILYNTGTEARESVSETYNERVRKIAEEMAKEHFEKLYGSEKWTDLPEGALNAYTDALLGNARIAVAHIAEAVSVALSTWGCQEDVIETYLKDEGLIPDSAQEDKPEPCPQELRCHTRNHPEGTCDCHNMGIRPQQGGEQNG